MKRKRIVIILSAVMILSTCENIAINAESVSDFSDDSVDLNEDMFQEKTSEQQEDDNLPTENEEPQMSQEESFNNQNDEEFENGFLSENMDGNEEFTSDVETDAEVFIEEIDNSITENSIDDSYNLKTSFGDVKQTNIFLGENMANTLNVYQVDEEGQKQILSENNYTVLGYVTEATYLEADHTLDNLSDFKMNPDTTGTWFLVFEGVTPYYGRQAVRIVVHDDYDLSLYNWMLDGDLLVGENPKDALMIFKNEQKSQLAQDEYTVLGYVTEAEYEKAECNIDKITEVSEVPNEPGQWVMIVEGIGKYHGKLATWITVEEGNELGMYQCNLAKEKITLGENVKDYIVVARTRNESKKVLATDNYKILGFVKEKDFAANGYDVNSIETIEPSANEIGGWYVVLEGTEPYSGRLVSWFELNENDASVIYDEKTGNEGTENTILEPENNE